MASQEQSVEQLFGAALDQRPEDRPAFLDRACACAPELRRRVEELLLADEEAGSFLETPLLSSLADKWDDITPVDDGARAAASDFKPAPIGRFDPGQIIAERFTVIRFIAHGGMGEVYEVEDRFLQGVHIALKVILPHIAGDAGSSRRFEQEVLLARKVTHPNLCPIYDISRCQEPTPPFVFLTMKLLAGETLASRLKRPLSIPRNECLSIFRQMTVGLGAIHDGGIVHRDIKPNNVMLDYSGSELCVSIMDFGLARLYDSQTTITVGLIAGTPGYIAPELLRGDPPSQATDIFALGVLFQQVLTNRCLSEEVHGLSVKASPALDAADVPSVYIHSVKEFLSEDPKRRCAAFQQIRSAFESGGSITERNLVEPVSSIDVPARRFLTRRNFVVGSALTACAAAGGIAWKWDLVDDLVHPIPRKRFVALLDWPPPDNRVKPMLLSVLDAIATELSRAEAFDRDLLVIAQKTITDITTPAQLSALRESLGANLVLAASGLPTTKELHLSLSVLDSSGTRTLREKQIRVPADQQTSLPEKAVRAAAELLNISHYQPSGHRIKVGTDNVEAYSTFQDAEVLMKEPNDTGLEGAIEKYKQAMEIDPHYAVAQAKLSWAFIRSYFLHGDEAALILARENCEAAIAVDPNLVEAHVGLAWIYQRTGDFQKADKELLKALALDPSNPRTLLYRAEFYAATEHWKEAEDAYARLVRLRPNYWLAHNEFGMFLNSQGKYPQALMEFRAASLASPKSSLAYANIAAVYLQLGKLPESLTNYTKSYQLNTNDLAAVGIAEVNRIQGNYKDAVTHAKEAVALSPSAASNWVELGDCCSNIPGMQKDAAAAYKKAKEVQEEQLRIEPKNGPACLFLALCNAKVSDLAGSAVLLKKAEALGINDLDSQLLKVRVVTLLSKLDEAFDTLSRCIQRGATAFQFQTMPDLEPLRIDSRYHRLVASTGPAVDSKI
ncbi:protein kinase domain-containing protein [Tunturiibacter lichenicola]|uniref:protein kinase domain-containing protein n=1 Tax=Tunturiibacter lichenicola TaxID=2051959 RepID=UPI003D9B3FF2